MNKKVIAALLAAIMCQNLGVYAHEGMKIVGGAIFGAIFGAAGGVASKCWLDKSGTGGPKTTDDSIKIDGDSRSVDDTEKGTNNQTEKIPFGMEHTGNAVVILERIQNKIHEGLIKDRTQDEFCNFIKLVSGGIYWLHDSITNVEDFLNNLGRWFILYDRICAGLRLAAADLYYKRVILDDEHLKATKDLLETFGKPSRTIDDLDNALTERGVDVPGDSIGSNFANLMEAINGKRTELGTEELCGLERKVDSPATNTKDLLKEDARVQAWNLAWYILKEHVLPKMDCEPSGKILDDLIGWTGAAIGSLTYAVEEYPTILNENRNYLSKMYTEIQKVMDKGISMMMNSNLEFQEPEWQDLRGTIDALTVGGCITILDAVDDMPQIAPHFYKLKAAFDELKLRIKQKNNKGQVKYLASSGSENGMKKSHADKFLMKRSVVGNLDSKKSIRN